MKIDHHIHTSRHSPDSSIDPFRLVERASSIGLDAVVITEHDYQWQPDELAELAARAGSLRVLSGAEISAREGHFLVYGLPSLEDVPPGIQVKDLIEVVRRHGAAIVAAHPFRWDQPGRYYRSTRWEQPARATLTSSTWSVATSPSSPSASNRFRNSWRRFGAGADVRATGPGSTSAAGRRTEDCDYS